MITVHSISQTIINYDALNELTDGDEAIQSLIFEGFLKDSQTRMDELELSVSCVDFPQVKLLAHALKGIARTLCAERLADQCLALEEAALANDIAKVKETFAHVRTEYLQLIRLLNNESEY